MTDCALEKNAFCFATFPCNSSLISSSLGEAPHVSIVVLPSLLGQSQQLTVQLQSRQGELQRTNEELAAQAKLLAEQNAEVERKNAQVEQARFALEEKADQLALTSKYKSEFLANMSHELRTSLAVCWSPHGAA